MATLSPAPIPDEPQRSPRWIDETATLTNAQVLELRQVIEQQSEAIDDLKAEAMSLRERVRALETCNDEFDRTLEQHDDRLDAVEATVALAATDSPALPDQTAELVPIRLMVAKPIGPRDIQLQEFHDALEQLVTGLLMYRRLGVDAGNLTRLYAIACEQAEVRFDREQRVNAEEDAAAEAWLAHGRAS